MYRQRQDNTFVSPRRIDHNFAAGSLRADVLDGNSIDPRLARLFHVLAVITDKLQHG